MCLSKQSKAKQAGYRPIGRVAYTLTRPQVAAFTPAAVERHACTATHSNTAHHWQCYTVAPAAAAGIRNPSDGVAAAKLRRDII